MAGRLQLRYTESRQASAELLRMVLAQMSRHDAALNPLTFAVWYEHCGHINTALSEQLGRLLSAGRPIDDAAIEALYRQHVAPTDAQALERIGHDLHALMARLGSTAQDAGAEAGSVDAHLKRLAEVIRTNDVQRLAVELSHTLHGTARLSRSAQALERDASHGRDEIARLRRELQRARAEALTDPLTGLLNRKAFDQRVAAMLARPATPPAAHALVMFDIDHFKRVNDEHGHVVGDRVIRAVADALQQSTTLPTAAVARYGGEEFALVAADTDVTRCAQWAEQARAQVRALRFRSRATQELVFTVTVSAGMAVAQAGDDATTLVARADEALYRSKQQGRDRLTLG